MANDILQVMGVLDQCCWIRCTRKHLVKAVHILEWQLFAGYNVVL